MKVRKFLFAGALIAASLFSVNSVMAETTPSKTDQVTVNLKFKPVQSIYVNADQKTVNFLYTSQDHYRDGVAAQSLKKHLTVFSSGGFQVTFQTSDPKFTSGNTNITIPVEDVSVTATASEGKGLSDALLGAALPLSNSSTTFIKSNKGGIDLKFDVEYENTGFDAAKYINGYNKDFLTEGATVFTTQLTYTIATN